MLELLDFLKENILFINLLIVTVYLGFEMISKVPVILLVRQAEITDYLTIILGVIGIVLGTINVVGGHAVTNRMLEMFKKK
tara:strand:- start:181 stop:423 length:243 start_codon:yes stop_codon:yes gene_type:complete